MTTSRLAQAVLERPWALQPHLLRAIPEILGRHERGERLTEAELRERIGDRDPVRQARVVGPSGAGAPTRSEQAIFVLPIIGVLAQRGGMVGATSTPLTSTDRVGQAFDRALQDPRVGAIVLDVDSPGGEVFGVAELGDRIRAARGRKPIVAVVNSLAASGAYWIASQAPELVVTPGGEVGSIGVWAAHTEFSEADRRLGVRTTIVRAGRYKYELNAFEPMTAAAKVALQARIDDYYGLFLAAVARGRGTTVDRVRRDFGEGRVFGARQAVRLGMADRVSTLDAEIRRLGSRIASRAPGRGGAALEVELRRRRRAVALSRPGRAGLTSWSAARASRHA